MKTTLDNTSASNDEKPGIDAIEAVEREHSVIGNDGTKSTPHAHDIHDPQDPLNWSLPLKVSAHTAGREEIASN